MVQCLKSLPCLQDSDSPNANADLSIGMEDKENFMILPLRLLPWPVLLRLASKVSLRACFIASIRNAIACGLSARTSRLIIVRRFLTVGISSVDTLLDELELGSMFAVTLRGIMGSYFLFFLVCQWTYFSLHWVLDFVINRYLDLLPLDFFDLIVIFLGNPNYKVLSLTTDFSHVFYLQFRQ